MTMTAEQGQSQELPVRWGARAKSDRGESGGVGARARAGAVAAGISGGGGRAP